MSLALNSITLSQLEQLSAKQTMVLTVNNRLALALRKQLIKSHALNNKVFELPSLFSVDVWLSRLHQDMLFHPQALSHLRTRFVDGFIAKQLWEECIAQCEEENYFLNASQVAKLAADARQILIQWQLNIPDFATTPEYDRFKVWHEAYEQRLQDLDADDSLRIHQALLSLLKQSINVTLPTNIVLYGINELNPLHQAIMACLQENYQTQVWVLADQREPASKQHKVACKDKQYEWQEAALWAKNSLDNNPSGRYAIIDPGLNTNAAMAHRVLQRQLAPHFKYNVSVARPLSQWPIIRCALAWLALLVPSIKNKHAKLKVDVVGKALLNAGFLHMSWSEQFKLNQLDAAYRHSGVVEITFNQLFESIQKRTPHFAALLEQAWGQAQSKSSQSLSDWVKCFNQFLQNVGFPGRTQDQALSFRLCQLFDESLHRFARYEPLLGKLSASEALGYLERLLQQVVYQPPTDKNSHLDVLGVLEASYGQWDEVWVLGLNDDALPAAAAPNPLLPPDILRKTGVPHASSEREKQWADQMFDDLSRTAPNILFSYAQMDGERECRASSYIEALPELAHKFYLSAPTIKAVVEKETLQDDQAPPLTKSTKVKGGVSVLNLQAQNPQWAFVRHRLGGQGLKPYSDGVDNTVRGIFLHDCAEYLWKKLENQSQLKQYMQQALLEPLIDEAIEHGAIKLNDYPPVLQGLEKDRAKALFIQWLDFEANRLDDFTVENIEKETHWEYQYLKLTFRIDRVDRLNNGSYVVMDYKSGKPNDKAVQDWLRRPPVNLQLPLYASVLNQDDPSHEVDGIMLAYLHRKKAAVVGIGEIENPMDGFKNVTDASDNQASWSDLRQQWRSDIYQLADDFLNGKAVNRSLSLDDLQYCDIRPFLRLNDKEQNDE